MMRAEARADTGAAVTRGNKDRRVGGEFLH